MTLPRDIASLLRPAAYAEGSAEVGFQQTHISYLFFTPKYVYKVKKPVDFGFLDFTTLDKRLFFCNEEVRLNRRLAPDTYIGVVPIIRTKQGLKMEGKGKPIEYAVKMKRLDPKKMLDARVKNNTATPALIRRVARKIAAFHKKAKTGPDIEKYGSIETVAGNMCENFSQTRPFIGKTISRNRFNHIKTYANDFLSSHEKLFRRRVRRGFIKACHGDIHSEHVSVTRAVSIIDCIEFTPRFRCSDTASDAAFLSMDLEFRGRGDLAREFDKAYFERSHDREGGKLLNFYKCYRAFVRGKVESFKLTEAEESGQEKQEALINAIRYFRLAHLYATSGFKPAMVIVCGLSGTGKSEVARALSRKTGFIHLASDVVRKELANIPATKHRYERFGSGMYSKQATNRTYSALIKQGGEYLKQGRDVILDATFSTRKHIKAACREASNKKALLYVIECTAPDRVVKQRILDREEDKTAVSDATWEIYKDQKKCADKIESPDMRIKTTSLPDILADEVIQKVFYRKP